MTDTTSEAPEAQAPEPKAMSSEEAIVALTDSGETQDQPAPAGDDADPLLAVMGDEETKADDPETPAIDAPRSWSAEDKAVFATLTPEAQAIVLAREEDRDRATSKAVTEAGQARKQAETEARTIAQYRAQMDAFLPQALQTFASRWEGVDWAEEARIDPVRAFQAKAQYDAEQAQIQQLQAAQQQAQAVEHQHHVRSVSADLEKLAPDLVDPKEGAGRVSALATFLLQEQGYSPENLKWATGHDLALAYDAMRYRQLQAKAKAAIERSPSAPTKPVKPAGSGDRGSSETNVVSTAKRRLAQTGRADDAVAVIQALGL